MLLERSGNAPSRFTVPVTPMSTTSLPVLEPAAHSPAAAPEAVSVFAEVMASLSVHCPSLAVVSARLFTVKVAAWAGRASTTDIVRPAARAANTSSTSSGGSPKDLVVVVVCICPLTNLHHVVATPAGSPHRTNIGRDYPTVRVGLTNRISLISNRISLSFRDIHANPATLASIGATGITQMRDLCGNRCYADFRLV